jgi:hypothetical protein
MNMKKEVFNKQNKTDYSLRQGAIKSAEDSGLKDLTVEDCIEWEEPEDYTNNSIESYYDPIVKATMYRKVVK